MAAAGRWCGAAVSEETIRRAIRAGKIPAYNSRGRLRVRLSDVLQPYAPQRKGAQA
jgi:predicted site-specific integrase-resolvase